MALNIRLRARGRKSDGRFTLRVRGQDRASNAGLADCIRSGMKLVDRHFERLALRVTVDNDIPVGVGLGSSAAGLVCGIAIATAARGESLNRTRIAHLASAAEGHADNAATAVFGGICLVVPAEPELLVRVLRPPRDLIAAVVIPSAILKTSLSRSVLPRSYRRSDVVHNLQRTAFLAAALAQADASSVISVLDDRLHEPYRAPLVRGLSKALAERSVTTGVVLSGSGPSVLVLARGAVRAAARRVAQRFHDAGMRTRILSPRFDRDGLVIAGLP